jgi:hypothetical protein
VIFIKMLPNKQKKKRKCVEEQFTKFAAFTQPVAIQIIKNEKNGPKLLEISFGEVNLKTVRCCVSANVLFVEKGQYVLLSHRRRYRSRFGLIFNTVQDAASFVKALCLVCPKKRNTPTNNSLRDVKPDSLSNYVLLSVESQRIPPSDKDLAFLTNSPDEEAIMEESNKMMEQFNSHQDSNDVDRNILKGLIEKYLSDPLFYEFVKEVEKTYNQILGI